MRAEWPAKGVPPTTRGWRAVHSLLGLVALTVGLSLLCALAVFWGSQ